MHTLWRSQFDMMKDYLSTSMPGASPDSTEWALLVLKVAKQDIDLKPEEAKRVGGAIGGVKSAIGQLPFLIDSGLLPEAYHGEAARLILSYAAQQMRAIPARPNHEENANVAAYAILLFQSPGLAAALSREERERLIDVLWRYARQQMKATPGKEMSEINERAIMNALDTLEHPHIFNELSREARGDLAALLLRYATDGMGAIDSSKSEPPRPLWLMSLTRGHLFRFLSTEERQAVALKVLSLIKGGSAMPSGEPISLPRVVRIRDLIFMLSREHVFKALPAENRMEAASSLLRYASLQICVTVLDPDEVRLRIDPVVFALGGLAKQVIFGALGKDAAREAALLFLRYAKGEISLDSRRPEKPDTQIKGIKIGIEGLSREYIFELLPSAGQRDAAIWIMKYANRVNATGSPHFPVEDLTGGIVTRSRRVLKRKFILAALPEDLRRQAA